MPARLNIALQRNEDWSRTIYVSASDGPVDLTGMTVAMQVRDKLSRALIASANCEITDAVNGEITVTLKCSGPSPLANYGSMIQTVNLPYDLCVSEPDGFHTPLFSGLIIISRGETIV